MNMEYRKRLAAAAILLFFGGFFLGAKFTQIQVVQEKAVLLEEIPAYIGNSAEEMLPAEALIVHVAGAVNQAGIYQLEQGQRVEDALQLAGLAENAAADVLNRAALLHDGDKIIVPTTKEAEGQTVPAVNEGQGVSEDLVNINQANLQQLIALPGIGEVKGQAIIDYRTEHGAFQKLEEIKNVNGIGNAAYDKIKSRITL